MNTLGNTLTQTAALCAITGAAASAVVVGAAEPLVRQIVNRAETVVDAAMGQGTSTAPAVPFYKAAPALAIVTGFRGLRAGFGEIDTYLRELSTPKNAARATNSVAATTAITSPEAITARLHFLATELTQRSNLKFEPYRLILNPNIHIAPQGRMFTFANPTDLKSAVDDIAYAGLVTNRLAARSTLLFWRAYAAPSAMAELRARIQELDDADLKGFLAEADAAF